MANKNITIRPDTLVPVEIRITVYKEAMDVIKAKELKHNLCSHGICLLLPCLLWNLTHYLDDSPCGEPWDHLNIVSMFPELTKEKANVIIAVSLNKGQTSRNQMRLVVLRKMIQEAEQEQEINKIANLLMPRSNEG